MADQVDKKPRGNQGGRPKGAPNKRSGNMRRRLEAMGFEPLEEMVNVIKSTTDLDKKWDRCAFLIKHLYPTLKEVEQLPDDKDDESESSYVSERSTEELEALALQGK